MDPAGVAPFGRAGFCALRLAQRLLDPVPAGNCKLQTLRQYYRLPERGAHTALGDVGTVADLFATVLRPIAEQRGLETWEQLAADAAEEWVPSRIAFGKHKGRSIAEARTDAGLRRWLDGLAQSANARNARMGRWYLRSLEAAAEPSQFVAWEYSSCPSSSLGTRLSAKLGFVGLDESADAIPMEALGKPSFQDKGVTKLELGHEGSRARLVLYVNPELQRLRALVDAARARLAELEAGFTIEKAKVEAMKARLFARLRAHFQRRDRLRLVVGYRRKYLESLVRQGEEEAGKIAQEYRQASTQQEREYAETAAALAEQQELTAEEAAEVSQFWRKLVKLFHPDRCAWRASRRRCRESGHRQRGALHCAIAEDPLGYILRQGWAALDFGEEREIAQLRRLWESIELEIIRVLEAGNALKESPDYELHRLTTQTPAFFEETVRRHVEGLEKEAAAMEGEAEELAREIEELTGETPGIG